MRQTAVALSILFGTLSIFGAGYWSLFAAAYGAFDREGTQIVVLLLAGPLSILPAGLVGRKRPFLAGVWLVSGAVFCFFWHLGVIQSFDQLFRSFEAYLPVLMICGPMLLVGPMFLWAGREAPISWWSSPVVKRRTAIVAGTLGVVAAAGLLIWYLSLPVWTLTVTPEGQRSTSIRFDPRYSRNPGPETLLELRADLKATFDVLFKPTDREILGTSVLRGSGVEQTSVWKVVRNEKGLVLVLQDGAPIDRNWMFPEPALSNAARAAVDQILRKAWMEYPPAPPTR